MKHPLLALFFTTAAFCSAVSLVELERAGASEKPHLVIVIAEGEYKTDQTLPPFAKANLAKDFRVTIVKASAKDRNDIPNIVAVKDADVVLLSIRRRTLPPKQLAVIRDYIRQGRPVVGIRTSCHAFCLREEGPPEGLADWPEFDAQVIGGNYHDHYGNKLRSYALANKKQANHPVLQGVNMREFRVFGSLYRCQPLADSTTLLMTGRAEGIASPEPVAWTNTPKTGNRVFFTSLGHPQDFKVAEFVRLLRNGIYWAADLAAPERAPITLSDPPQK